MIGALGLVAAAAACPGDGVALQVLGSGGPELADGRAASAYLLWSGGRARALVDAGGGSALRFHEAGARFEDLDVVLISHLHADHSADLPALVKAGYFSPRDRDLPLLGPVEGPGAGGLAAWAAALFDPAAGAYRYLGGHLAGGAAWRLRPQELRPPGDARALAFEAPGLRAWAAAVPHGPMPALAFRVELDGVAVVFSGDTTAATGSLAALAAGADLLVAHHAIPEGPGQPTHLHMDPAQIGRVAAEAGVRGVVLSHWMRRTPDARPAGVLAVRRSYAGPVMEAEDLLCVPIPAATPR